MGPQIIRQLLTALLLVITMSCCLVTGGSDKIRLENVQVLTLHQGEMTNARRSRPIPQLQCTGGRAGCREFEPTTVQCYNRGSDGDDVQWECKTEMDKRYKFGNIEVSCEGFDYPDDPYILKGSCGLEYTLDYTSGNGGWGSGGSWFGGNNDNKQNHQSQKSAGGGLGDFIMIVIIGMVVYFIYRSFQSPSNQQQQQYSTTNDDYPDHGHRGDGNHGNQAPPPGFRPEYTPGMGDGGGCGGRRNQGAGNFGGFWTGAATGGLLGYFMGNNNNRGGMYNRPYARQHNTGGGFFGGGGGGGFGGGGGGATASTSGFGGTRRR